MKNAGMAGAVALVGIGLITIGLSNFANRAEAVPSVHSGIRIAVASDFVGDCDQLPQTWFSAEGQLITCVGIGAPPPSAPYGDLNGDGVTDKVDMYTALWLPSTRAWAFNNGSPVASTFVQANEQVRGATIPMTLDLIEWHRDDNGGPDSYVAVQLVSIADIDGDGRRDLLVARDTNSGYPSYYWHRNITGGDPLVADINRDGFVNAQDLGLLIAAWTG